MIKRDGHYSGWAWDANAHMLLCFCMSKEVPFQADMFTGELIDTRSKRQKQKDKEREQFVQAEMFSQREIAQFGVKANPKLPLSPKTRIELAIQDPRTEAEKEQDMLREIEKHTYPMTGIRDDAGEPEVGDEECRYSTND